MMPRSVSQKAKEYRTVPYGGGTVRKRGEKWEARWTENGVRRGKLFLIPEEAEDFLRALYRARGKTTFEERRQKYDGNFVYFIQAGEDGLIKIGHASNPAARLKQMQTGSPLELRIIAITDGGYQRELELHRSFRHLHVRDEWFQPGRELLWWIRRFAADATVE